MSTTSKTRKAYYECRICGKHMTKGLMKFIRYDFNCTGRINNTYCHGKLSDYILKERVQ